MFILIEFVLFLIVLALFVSFAANRLAEISGGVKEEVKKDIINKRKK